MEALRSPLGTAESLIRHQPLTSAAVAACTVLALPLLVAAYRDYRFYVAMGPHGLPNNWYGWYRQLLMARHARKDTTATAPYELIEAAAKEGPNSVRSFFSPSSAAGGAVAETRVELLWPRGARPEVCGFVAPQRQLTERATEAMKARMNAYLDELVRLNASVLQRELSNLEGPVPAVQLRQEGSEKGLVKLAPPLQYTRGEFVHIHPVDGTTHVVLSLVDSAHVIERQWGERHRVSGTLITWGYTLVYAPRDDKDLALWKDIVAAAARYATADIGKLHFPA